MSVTAAAIAKKAAVILAKDKRTWKGSRLNNRNCYCRCIASGDAFACNRKSAFRCGY